MRIKGRGRRFVLSLMTEGWQLDDVSVKEDGAHWLLSHARSCRHAEVLVSVALGEQTKVSHKVPVCGYVAIDGVIKTTIPF